MRRSACHRREKRPFRKRIHYRCRNRAVFINGAYGHAVSVSLLGFFEMMGANRYAAELQAEQTNGQNDSD